MSIPLFSHDLAWHRLAVALRESFIVVGEEGKA